MMTFEAIARNYLSYLEKGDVPKVLSLFSEEAIVVSPIYGTRQATEFYRTLNDDTQESIITFDGIFLEENTKRMALSFDYRWIVRNGKQVDFKVVDIIEFNSSHKIEKLTIIYDTVISRELVRSLK